jgi:hypothetical protein
MPTTSAATATPTPAPTATLAAGFTRYTNTELGYSVDLPAGWRRAVCSAGIVTMSPLMAYERFVNSPESEEYISGGTPMVMVNVTDARGLTPRDWLERSMYLPDARIEPATLGQRTGARAFLGATGETLALAFAARGWIYAIQPYFGEGEELRRIVQSLQILDDATLGRQAAATPAPRSIESLVDSIADGFARKDVATITDAMAPCVTAGVVPGHPVLLSRTAYLASLRSEFAAGTSVRVAARPIESDPDFGRFVRSTWSKPGEPDQRVDLLLSAQGDRWSLAGVLIRVPGY